MAGLSGHCVGTRSLLSLSSRRSQTREYHILKYCHITFIEILMGRWFSAELNAIFMLEYGQRLRKFHIGASDLWHFHARSDLPNWRQPFSLNANCYSDGSPTGITVTFSPRIPWIHLILIHIIELVIQLLRDERPMIEKKRMNKELADHVPWIYCIPYSIERSTFNRFQWGKLSKKMRSLFGFYLLAGGCSMSELYQFSR